MKRLAELHFDHAPGEYEATRKVCLSCGKKTFAGLCGGRMPITCPNHNLLPQVEGVHYKIVRRTVTIGDWEDQ